jgi:hypothetical protein
MEVGHSSTMSIGKVRNPDQDLGKGLLRADFPLCA